jgi:hypothetical protein
MRCRSQRVKSTFFGQEFSGAKVPISLDGNVPASEGGRYTSEELGQDAYDGEEAAGVGAFFAVAEEEVAAAGGAEFRGENIFFA